MKTLPVLSLLGLSLSLSPGVDLATTYEEGATFRVERETKLTLETTDMSIERDGVEMERGGDRGGGGASSFKTVVQVDRVGAVAGGRPVEVRRTFETLTGEASRFGQELSLETPLAGATLLLTADEDGDVDVELEEGDPVEDEALEGHRIELELDALLPEGEVEEGDSWTLDGEDLLVALGFAVDGALFELPEFESPWGGGGGREGRGGRGPRGGRGGPSAERLFQEADWDVTATLTDEVEEVNGVSCRVVRITAEASASFEPEEREGGGRGFAPRGTSRALPAARGTEVDIELEGTLYVDAEGGRPARLEIEGTLDVETDNEMERRGSTMRIRRSQSGTLQQTVDVTRE